MRLLTGIRPRDLAGKACLVRVNLDIARPHAGSFRLLTVLPTLKLLIKNGARPIIMGHKGRPGGIVDSSLSVKPAVDVLSKLAEIRLDWLENLRFDPREEENDEKYARELARRADMYVNDDFATSHRASTSIVDLPRFLPSYAGLLIEKEVGHLTRVRDNPEKPFIVVIGGMKIADKAGTIANLAKKDARFLLGSAYGMMRETLPHGADISLPVDYIPGDGENLDIGPKTVKIYEKILKSAKTVLWSGPVGKAEDPRYAKGSLAVARAIAESGAFSVAGGGDTADFLEAHGMLGKFGFVSTGGGATLSFLSGAILPGIAALDAAE